MLAIRNEYKKQPNQPLEIKSNLIGNVKLPKSMVFQQLKDTGEFYLNNAKLNIDLDNNIIKVNNKQNSYPLNDELLNILNGKNIQDVNDFESLLNYQNLLTDSGFRSKHAKRYQELVNRIDELFPKEEGLKHLFGDGLICEAEAKPLILSNDPKELWNRLTILLSAKSHGHNNSLQEISAILDQLLKLNEINITQYKNFLPKNEQ